MGCHTSTSTLTLTTGNRRGRPTSLAMSRDVRCDSDPGPELVDVGNYGWVEGAEASEVFEAGVGFASFAIGFFEASPFVALCPAIRALLTLVQTWTSGTGTGTDTGTEAQLCLRRNQG